MTNPTLPFVDVSAMMSQFKMPGIDMAAIVEARRKDIDALVAANAATFESMQAVARKQTEILSESMHAMQEAAKGMAGGTGMDSGKQAEVVRKGFEKTLANMKELAEMARHAQSDAMALITQRATQQMRDAKAMVTPK
ncbi:MAG: TIGR01841 family phasin [Burkholderiales bacterium]